MIAFKLYLIRTKNPEQRQKNPLLLRLLIDGITVANTNHKSCTVLCQLYHRSLIITQIALLLWTIRSINHPLPSRPLPQFDSAKMKFITYHWLSHRSIWRNYDAHHNALGGVSLLNIHNHNGHYLCRHNAPMFDLNDSCNIKICTGFLAGLLAFKTLVFFCKILKDLY